MTKKHIYIHSMYLQSISIIRNYWMWLSSISELYSNRGQPYVRHLCSGWIILICYVSRIKYFFYHSLCKKKSAIRIKIKTGKTSKLKLYFLLKLYWNFCEIPLKKYTGNVWTWQIRHLFVTVCPNFAHEKYDIYFVCVEIRIIICRLSTNQNTRIYRGTININIQ